MGQSAIRLAVEDCLGGVADSFQTTGEQWVAAERTAGRIDRGGVGQADRFLQDQFLVSERCVQFGDVDVADLAARCRLGCGRSGR